MELARMKTNNTRKLTYSNKNKDHKKNEEHQNEKSSRTREMRRGRCTMDVEGDAELARRQ
jgi:hypothetical protein